MHNFNIGRNTSCHSQAMSTATSSQMQAAVRCSLLQESRDVVADGRRPACGSARPASQPAHPHIAHMLTAAACCTDLPDAVTAVRQNNAVLACSGVASYMGRILLKST